MTESDISKVMELAAKCELAYSAWYEASDDAETSRTFSAMRSARSSLLAELQRLALPQGEPSDEYESFKTWSKPFVWGDDANAMTLAWMTWQARAALSVHPSAPSGEHELPASEALTTASNSDCAGGSPCSSCPDKRQCSRGCIRQQEANQ